ncbi:hypothetical protein HDU97_009868 [Phlyctochytrium planicorne]|nr:hypothetical protein HDU97_009868 [Phlyctochytrium planicorne]
MRPKRGRKTVEEPVDAEAAETIGRKRRKGKNEEVVEKGRSRRRGKKEVEEEEQSEGATAVHDTEEERNDTQEEVDEAAAAAGDDDGADERENGDGKGDEMGEPDESEQNGEKEDGNADEGQGEGEENEGDKEEEEEEEDATESNPILDSDEDSRIQKLNKTIPANSRLADRLKKLQQLNRLRDGTKTDNKADLFTEFQNSKKNARTEMRAERKKREAEIMLMRETAEENGEDYERKRAMGYSVQDVERYEKNERKKAKRADTGFTDYAQVAAKKYKKLVAAIKPNFAQYADQKAEAQAVGVRVGAVTAAENAVSKSDGFYRDANSLAYAAQVKPSPKAVDKFVKLIEKDLEKRKTFSRRRRHNEDEDVYVFPHIFEFYLMRFPINPTASTYINERNMRFNKKIARAYDKHTADIRAAFERGTAL